MGIALFEVLISGGAAVVVGVTSVRNAQQRAARAVVVARVPEENASSNDRLLCREEHSRGRWRFAELGGVGGDGAGTRTVRPGRGGLLGSSHAASLRELRIRVLAEVEALLASFDCVILESGLSNWTTERLGAWTREGDVVQGP